MTVTAAWSGRPLGVFDTPEAGEKAVKLAQLMSDISERCYAAGWEHGTEKVLWSAVRDGPRKWGRDFISAKDIANLQRLSEAANGWIVFSDDGPKFVPMSEWKSSQA